MKEPQVSKREAYWQRRFAEYQDFLDDPEKLMGVSLSEWLRDQKLAHRKGRMPEHRIELLDAANPGWYLTANELWILSMYEVKKEMESGELSSRSYARLGQYRSDYRRGCYSDEHLALLDEHIPGWREPTRRSEELVTLENAALVVKEFLDTHGRLPNDDESNWFKNVRRGYMQGKYGSDRLGILDNLLGKEWRPKVNSKKGAWNRGIEGSLLRPGQITTWLVKQRTFYNLGILSDEMVAELNEKLPYWLD